MSVVLALHCTGCHSARDAVSQSTSFPMVCADRIDAQGSVVLLNGLNNHPDVLNELGNEICQLGYRIRKLSLAEWATTSEDPRREWLARLESVTGDLKREFPGEPVSLLGFSTGALAAMEFALTQGSEIESLLLIAPPLRLHWYNRMILHIASIIPFDLEIPSLAEPAYRAREYTLLSEYLAMQAFRREIDLRCGEQCALPRTSAVLSRHDEFAPADEVAEWLVTRISPPANVAILEKRASPERGKSHQVFNRASLEEGDWELLLQTLRSHYSRRS